MRFGIPWKEIAYKLVSDLILRQYGTSLTVQNTEKGKKKRSEYMTDITESGGGFRSGVAEREAFVFVYELVGMVDGAITSMAESCFIWRTEQGSHFFVTHITLNLHLCFVLCCWMLDFCFEFWGEESDNRDKKIMGFWFWTWSWSRENRWGY